MVSMLLCTAAALSLSAATTCSAPTRSQYKPMFFAKLWLTSISKPASTK